MKKAKCQRIEAFERWCWRRLWESLGLQGDPTSPKGNQSWIFIGKSNTEAKLQYFGQPDVKNWLIGKDSDARKDWRQEEKRKRKDGWDGWMASLTRWTWVWASSRSWWWTGKPGVLQSMGLQRVGHNWATEQQSVVLHGAVLSYVPLGGKSLSTGGPMKSKSCDSRIKWSPPQYSPLHPSTNDCHLLYRLLQRCPKWPLAFHLVQFPHNNKKIFLKHKLYHSPAQNPTHFFLRPDKLSPLLCSPYSSHIGLSIAAQTRHQSHVLTIRLPETFPVIAPSSNLGLCLKCHLPNVFLSHYSSIHDYSLLCFQS